MQQKHKNYIKIFGFSFLNYCLIHRFILGIFSLEYFSQDSYPVWLELNLFAPTTTRAPLFRWDFHFPKERQMRSLHTLTSSEFTALFHSTISDFY